MDHEFWQERWRRGEIGFHRSDTSPELIAHWPLLDVASSTRVFVPFCGKSLDMAWLAAAGHEVVGAELSALAVRQFFAEHEMTPSETRFGEHIVFSTPGITIWCGDMFTLPTSALEGIGAVYDRASLVALPAPMRLQYAAFMADMLAAGTRTLLLTLEFDQREMSGPPFSVSEREVASLFASAFDIRVIDTNEAIDRDPNLRKRGLTSLIAQTSILTRH
ncbi:MAG: thiopurine S-methyltransferase [Hyphomicrobiaceae bacterium]|nr:thiopurine S-methyltransferase [Hyphomicrobiaceae bacterium]